jgi:hypothetical protein
MSHDYSIAAKERDVTFSRAWGRKRQRISKKWPERERDVFE